METEPSHDETVAATTEAPTAETSPLGSGGIEDERADSSVYAAGGPLKTLSIEKADATGGPGIVSTSAIEKHEKLESRTESPTPSPSAKSNQLSSPAYTRSKRKRLEAEAAKAASLGHSEKRIKPLDTSSETSVATELILSSCHQTRRIQSAKEIPTSCDTSLAPSLEPVSPPTLSSKVATTEPKHRNTPQQPTSATDGRQTTLSASSVVASEESSVQPPHLAFCTEAYVELANRIVFTVNAETQRVLQELDLPGQAISGLGFLKTKNLRRPTILERWTPFEIAMFQASLAHHGKHFELVQKDIQSKTVQEIVDFYYLWKKTSHYQLWKKEYVRPHLDTDSDDEK